MKIENNKMKLTEDEALEIASKDSILSVEEPANVEKALQAPVSVEITEGFKKRKILSLIAGLEKRSILATLKSISSYEKELKD